MGGGVKPPEPLSKKKLFSNFLKNHEPLWGGYPNLSGPTTEKKNMCIFPYADKWVDRGSKRRCICFTFI